MTPMSDVMTLLLCFFMLTSTFLQPEPIKVNTPSSVSEVKVPENNVLNILMGPDGKIFLGTDNKNDMNSMLATMTDKFGIPTDSIDGGKSEFQEWVQAAVDANPDIKLAIKCDATTPYKVVKKVMSELQDMNQNRYQLITNLKTSSED